MIGLHNSTFYGVCFLEDNVVISNSMIGNTVILAKSSVMSCSLVGSNSDKHLETLQRLEVGPENRGRQVLVHPEMKYWSCVAQIFGNVDSSMISSASDAFSPLNYGIIGQESHLFNCSRIYGNIIGNSCHVTDSSLENCILINDSLSVKPIIVQSDALLRNVIMHEGCVASSHCHIENAYLFEYSSVSSYARINSSILAPDASISGGECHNSLVGPSLGFHHQSLLIACLWPHGRGNISYGAKVGSNHTGRINDQECWMGEGVFVGLNADIKFPFNSMDAPYSLIASGTSCLSQKVLFPFSLLMNCDASISANFWQYNVIKPGWILWGNPYFMERSAMKFKQRRKARLHRTDYSLTRPRTILVCVEALKFIQMLRQETGGDWIFPSSSNGLGQCVVSARDLGRAENAYRDFIKTYALTVSRFPRVLNIIVIMFIPSAGRRHRLKIYHKR